MKGAPKEIADGGDGVAGSEVCVAMGTGSGHRNLRGVCYGDCLLRATVGAAIHHVEPRGDHFYAGAGVCSDYFVSGDRRTVRRALEGGSFAVASGNIDCGIAGTGCGS